MAHQQDQVAKSEVAYAVDMGTLDSLLEDLRRASECFATANRRLSELHERVFGPVNELGGVEADHSEPPAQGAVARISAEIERLQSIHTYMSGSLERLERL